MYRACRSMTNHLAHTAREVDGWLGSSLPTDVSLIGQLAPKMDLHVDCPMTVQHGVPNRNGVTTQRPGGSARLGAKERSLLILPPATECGLSIAFPLTPFLGSPPQKSSGPNPFSPYPNRNPVSPLRASQKILVTDALLHTLSSRKYWQGLFAAVNSFVCNS